MSERAVAASGALYKLLAIASEHMRSLGLVVFVAGALARSGCTVWPDTTERSGAFDTAAPPGSESKEATEPPQARSVPLLQQGSLTQALALPDGSGDLLLGDRGGRLLLLRSGADAAQEPLDISDRVDDTQDWERGFKGAAIHPDFMSNGMLFLVYDNTIETDDADSRAHPARARSGPVRYRRV